MNRAELNDAWTKFRAALSTRDNVDCILLIIQERECIDRHVQADAVRWVARHQFMENERAALFEAADRIESGETTIS